jgi:hypothetical protein
MAVIYDQYGIPRKASVFSAASKLQQLKIKNGRNPWPVIAECFKIWEQTYPSKYESYLTYLDEIKDSRKVTAVGNKYFSGVSRASNGQMSSYVADMPKQVMYMIRAVYDSNELPMNKEFWAEFVKKFPKYSIRKSV